MRRALGYLLVILSVCVALLGLSAQLGRDATLTAATVDSIAAVDEARDYLSVTRGVIASEGRWLMRRVDDNYLIPVFAQGDALTPRPAPRLFALVPLDELPGVFVLPDAPNGAIRIDIAGQRSSQCASPATRMYAPDESPATTLESVPCVLHGRVPAPLYAVVIGLVIILLPFGLLSIWLLRPRQATQKSAPREGFTVPDWISFKLIKPVAIITFAIVMAFAKLGDETVPIIVKSAPEAASTIAKQLPETLPPVAKHTLTDAMKALQEDEELPLKVMKTGKDAADWSKRIEALDLGPEDSLARRMVQLDAVSLLEQGTDGRYRLVRVEALLEDSVIRNGDNALSRIVSRRGYQHWKEVHVFEAPEGAMGFDATTSRDALHQTGTLRFVEGDWATYRNGQPVLLRLVEVPRGPEQKAPEHELKTALLSLKGPRMLVRSVGAAPLEHQLPVPEQAR